MKRIEYQKGEIVGNYGVVFVERIKTRKARFECPLCKNEFVADIANVKAIYGHTISCGCHKRNVHRIHGLSNHRLAETWGSMMERCHSEKHPHYNRYGGRGILICERWKDIRNFIEDMYPTFKEGLTLDRIDNNGNYEPSNCRWATWSEQNRNKDYSGKIPYRGVSFNSKKNYYQAAIRLGNKVKYIMAAKNPLTCAILYDNFVKDNNLPHKLNFG